ncbi:hypothetical protein KDL01_25845 [Actinospica durhamensis]|uniref:Aminoglycoside phosphotransferase domain-containing protein n=1 Tax=Actinospica durhamensis TaxID=1508375 RepID=A0A941IPN1_9ACTN|nr:hypothetical protein [Actinospica durhamensis]MBR7836730.1 hypothetical protein [Actinospica durhamensis]
MTEISPPSQAADAAEAAEAAAELSAVSAWCARHLGSEPEETLFSAGHLSRVFGLRLRDGRAVVVKVRAAEPRLAGCTEVQRHLWQAGFPCPQPLAGPLPLSAAETALAMDCAVNAETLVTGGAPYPAADLASQGAGSPGAAAFAGLLARLIALAPAPDQVSDLAPPPAWVHWDHPHPGVWPPPDDRDVDLNAFPETAWLDELGQATRARLAATRDAEPVIGHCDWESHNLEFRAGEPWVVHDWDSVVCAAETVIVGVAAAMWPAGSESFGADIAQSEQFLEAYQRARGRAFSSQHLEEAWAAGLWIRAFNAKKYVLDGLATLTPAEADERARRAGLA